MNLDALSARNRKLAERRHRPTFRERLRRALLRLYARLPAPFIRHPERNTFLIIRPDQLGDVLLTMPAILALRRSLGSNARIVALAGPWAAEAIAAYHDIDMVLTIPFPGFGGKAGDSILAPYRMALRWAGMLRKVRAETALVMRPDHWWGALLAYMAGIPHRVGFDLPDVRPFVSLPISNRGGHAVLRAMQLVERWTGPIPPEDIAPRHFPISDPDREFIAGLLAPHSIDPTARPVIIHPGASTPLKFWAAENWANVADRLADRLKAAVIFTGSDREHQQIWDIMGHMRHKAVSLAGETNIPQLAALYGRAAVVLGPDTGPLHLAAASGAPTVHLFGPADPALFGPWGDPKRQVALTSDILCRPCRILDWSGDDPANHPCVRLITPAQVYEAALQAASWE